ncbi:thioredoxin-like protein [Pelagophyceae sp. CCMP2097]|nr:thioredoxin-like protein [Pelagophyceae sp. CCMP2097]
MVDFPGMSVKDLKTYLTERGVSMRGVSEKAELIKLAEDAHAQDEFVTRTPPTQPARPKGVVTVGDANAWDALLKKSGDTLVVVDFTATWCGPCKQMAPKFDALATANADAVFAKVDVDECQSVAQACGVSCMPTFQLFKQGKMVAKLEGADEASLAQLIAQHKK